MAKDVKTNAMRLLEQKKVAYEVLYYDSVEGENDGVSVAKRVGKPVEMVYKTLVTQGASKSYFVFLVPVAKELSLKAAAKAVGEKWVEMIPVADITKITGYVKGGCSPLAMKKQFTTVFDASCLALEAMICSGGKIGAQILCAPSELLAQAQGTTAELTL